MRAFFSKHWISSLVMAILILWLGWWICVNALVEVGKRGEIGDLFGGINALFSGLALGGVVTAVILQSKELELQRGEMRLQRDQLELQRKELELSREEYKRMASANEEAAQALIKQLKLQAQASRINGLSSLLNVANERLIAADTNTRAYSTAMERMHNRETDLQNAINELDSYN